MNELQLQWQQKIRNALVKLASELHTEFFPAESESLIVSIPPQPEMGDLAFPMFPYAKVFKRSPQELAQKVWGLLAPDDRDFVLCAGPYINVTYDPAVVAKTVVPKILKANREYGKGVSHRNQRIMIEFSCPNTNKPLHLGHLRNDAIGESMSRILKGCGAHVLKVNLVNNRGVHICKSMLAYKKFGNGATPETAGRKPDHFVGDYYVKYDKWQKSYPEAEKEVRAMLLDWERGDAETIGLWKTMNEWVMTGIRQTYNNTGISFDRYYFEDKTYLTGRDEVLKGLEKGVFFREPDGSVSVDLKEIGLDKKVLLRSDGTSVYMTQDIGTAILRYNDWPFSRLIYIVASEQNYHFKVLFHILHKLGYEWAADLYHLSYGMVNLPDGRMKSREGTIVDADDLIDELSALAHGEIRERERDLDVDDVEWTAKAVSLAALHYFLLQCNPLKDMIFDPAESISFSGDTGPYLQYTGARICSILRKYEEAGDRFAGVGFDPVKLSLPVEKAICKLLGIFPEVVESSARQYNPSLIAGYLYDLCREFSRYYHDHPILRNDDRSLVVARISLSHAVKIVLENGFDYLNIPFLQKM